MPSAIHVPDITNRLDLWRFPHVGTSKTQWHQPGGPIFYLGAGQRGVVRTIWCTCAPVIELTLRIFPDCGNVPDPTQPGPPEHLAASIPMPSLFGSHFVPWTAPRAIETSVFQVHRTAADPSAMHALRLNVPVPFSDGCLIQLIETVEQEESVASVYSWASYELGALPDTPASDYRLRSAGLSVNMTYGGGDAVFLNRSGKPGLVAALMASQNANRAGIFENNWSFKFDGEGTAGWQTSGAEDLFDNCYYWGAGAVQGLRAGTIAKSFTNPAGPYIHESYRMLDAEPVSWETGAIGSFPALTQAGDTCDCRIHCLFYEKK